MLNGLSKARRAAARSASAASGRVPSAPRHESADAAGSRGLSPDPEAGPHTDDRRKEEVRLTDSGGLTRSAVVDERIRSEGKRCLTPDGVPNNQYDGLIYLLYQLEDSDGEVEAGDIIPRYFGKAEIYGKKCELSSNFEEIAGDRDATRSFARWGDEKYWHVGELSMSLHGESKKKTHWVEALFKDSSRTLKRPTYLWVRAWDATDDVGPYGVPATLAEVEPLLIGLAYDAYPNQLLNKSGTPDDAPIKVGE